MVTALGTLFVFHPECSGPHSGWACFNINHSSYMKLVWRGKHRGKVATAYLGRASRREGDAWMSSVNSLMEVHLQAPGFTLWLDTE